MNRISYYPLPILHIVGIFNSKLYIRCFNMMQTLSIDILVGFWTISVLIHPVYWLTTGPNSKLEGVGIRFFDTPLRSIITSEIIGIVGCVISLILDIENLSNVVFIGLFSTLLVIMSVLIAHIMREPLRQEQYRKSQ